jgi:hypothetical protein
MTFQSRGDIIFPEFTGVRCYMMPFIQGRADSLPQEFQQYSDIIEKLVLDGQEGEIGLITIDESPVNAGKSQRGYGAGERTIHTEACRSLDTLSWGPPEPTWGRSGPGMSAPVLLAPDLRVLIANSIEDTCMVWNVAVEDTTPDGDLSMRASQFPRETGRMMGAGEVMEIGIFTPHEPIPQKESGNRQFFRIVGKGVTGREEGFTRNEHLERLGLIAA